MADLPPAPEPLKRPPFAGWLAARGIRLRAAGEAIGKSHEYVRLMCLEFGDPRRIVPDPATALRIAAWSRGEIQPYSFEPPPEGAA